MTQFSKPVQEDTFTYKPVPLIVPVSLVLAFLSLGAFIGFIGLFFAVVGTLVGYLAIRKIARSRGMLSGRTVAFISAFASLLCLLGGTVFQVYNYQTEIPKGFQRVSFTADISRKGFVNQAGVTSIHPDVKKLAQKPVFLKGFMFPQAQTKGIKAFLLLKDTGECCFGGNPKQSDMILIKLPPESKGMTYTDRRVSVAGLFQIRPGEEKVQDLAPVYTMKAKMVEVSRTPY